MAHSGFVVQSRPDCSIVDFGPSDNGRSLKQSQGTTISVSDRLRFQAAYMTFRIECRHRSLIISLTLAFGPYLLAKLAGVSLLI
jgi:hypothetical protein